jgi:lipoyl(octanoyl) transferase
MWIFIDSGNRSGFENMQLDEWLARSWFPATYQSVFRLYGWLPYTLSLGFHQSMHDVDVEGLHRAGYDLVRRPTGGRAVFHAEEITYSVVLDATRQSVNDVYERVSRALVSGFKNAGYNVEFAGTRQNFHSHYKKTSSISCFTASSEYEIQLDGRKLVGSAQRRYTREDGGVTALQHGSILTGPEHLQLVDFLNIDLETKRRLKDSMRRKSTDLFEYKVIQFDREYIKQNLKEAVMTELAHGNYREQSHSYFQSRMLDSTFSMEQLQ